MGAIVTKELLDAARKAGACADGLAHKAGTPITSLPASHLRWIEDSLPEFAKALQQQELIGSQVVGAVPLSILGLYGSGDGSGSGYGSGTESGAGYGYGYGYGDGPGYGSGAGYGYGEADIVAKV